MYNYSINFQPVLPGAPLQLGALSARLVHLWVNPACTGICYRCTALELHGDNNQQAEPGTIFKFRSGPARWLLQQIYYWARLAQPSPLMT